MTRNSNKPETGISGANPARDASPILRGAYVHSMGENPEDERSAAGFWERHGLSVQTLENPAERFSRRPDLCLLRDGAPWAYCEVKSVWQHRWSVHILHSDQEEVRTQMTHKSVEERIAGDLVTAERQLRAENGEHALLNFVLLVNRDSAASLGVLSGVLSGSAFRRLKSFKGASEGRLAQEIQRFRKNVDLCLWAIPGSDGELVIEGCYLFNHSLRSFAEEISGVRGGKVISLEPAA